MARAARAAAAVLLAGLIAAGSAAASVAEALVPAVVAVRDAVQSVVPVAPPPAVPARCAALATDIIVRWEVSSPATYTRRYQGVIWPGGASGPTWGIGYDGGHQSRQVILDDWAAHAAAPRLATTAGVIGTAARDRLPEWSGIRTPYALAAEVFTAASLPTYYHAARRALGEGFEDLPPAACAALVSVGYNRGWSMVGGSRAEMRELRDRCVPRGDAACIAEQILAMRRLWPRVPGLQSRRADEARLAVQS